MILQRAKAYKYKGKIKYKYTIVVPIEDIEKLGWDKGTKLKGEIIMNQGYLISKTP